MRKCRGVALTDWRRRKSRERRKASHLAEVVLCSELCSRKGGRDGGFKLAAGVAIWTRMGPARFVARSIALNASRSIAAWTIRRESNFSE